MASSNEVYLERVPKGFVFKPTDKEIILDYLMKRINNLPLPSNRIVSINLYEYNPDNLTEIFKANGEEWYFFTPTEKKYQKGCRPNRMAKDGYWKSTVGETEIYRGKKDRTVIGVKRTLVFYYGKPPNGLKTNWIMHEFVVPDQRTTTDDSMKLDDWVVCRIHHNKRNSSSSSSNGSKRRRMAIDGSSSSSDYPAETLTLQDEPMPSVMEALHGLQDEEQEPCLMPPITTEKEELILTPHQFSGVIHDHPDSSYLHYLPQQQQQQHHDYNNYSTEEEEPLLAPHLSSDDQLINDYRVPSNLQYHLHQDQQQQQYYNDHNYSSSTEMFVGGELANQQEQEPPMSSVPCLTLPSNIGEPFTAEYVTPEQQQQQQQCYFDHNNYGNTETIVDGGELPNQQLQEQEQEQPMSSSVPCSMIPSNEEPFTTMYFSPQQQQCCFDHNYNTETLVGGELPNQQQEQEAPMSSSVPCSMIPTNAEPFTTENFSPQQQHQQDQLWMEASDLFNFEEAAANWDFNDENFWFDPANTEFDKIFGVEEDNRNIWGHVLN